MGTIWVTQGAFVPSHLFHEFFDEKYKSFRDQVDTMITGEDILMSFIYAKKVGLPAIPLGVHEKYQHHIKTCFDMHPLGGRNSSGSDRLSLITRLRESFGDVFHNMTTFDNLD